MCEVCKIKTRRATKLNEVMACMEEKVQGKLDRGNEVTRDEETRLDGEDEMRGRHSGG